MIEVEVKASVSDLTALEHRLLELGFCKAKQVWEQDVYLDRADGSMRRADEALRIRRTLTSGEENVCITFKGKKLDDFSMTRRELETSVGSYDIVISIFQELGFSAVEPIVEKDRVVYQKENLSICLDRVKHLGCFLEAEILCQEEERDEALRRICKVLDLLDISLHQMTRNSYLSMLMGIED